MMRVIERIEVRPELRAAMQQVTARFLLLGNHMKHQAADLIREGNDYRMIIRECDGPVLLQTPLTFGIIGAILFVLFARFRWTILVTLISLFFRIQIVVEPPLQPAAAEAQSAMPSSAKHQRSRS